MSFIDELSLEKFDKLTDRSDITTEAPNSDYDQLDSLSIEDILKIFSKEDLTPQIAVKKALPQILNAIELTVSRLENGGRLFYIGAGTSGRLGVLDASECPPTFCTDPNLVQAIIAGGDKSIKTSSEKLEDSRLLSINDLKGKKISSSDVVVGITAGGTTPYVISALEYAKSIHCLAIAISSVPYNQAKIKCDVDIRLITGPEILTGSTRLKAGTAAKMTLNMISTITMIKLGRVYSNRMVDLSVTNEKLLDRAIRILEDLSEVSRKEAYHLLKLTKGSVKLSLLIALTNTDIDKANIVLKESNNNLRLAIKTILQK